MSCWKVYCTKYEKEWPFKFETKKEAKRYAKADELQYEDKTPIKHDGCCKVFWWMGDVIEELTGEEF